MKRLVKDDSLCIGCRQCEETCSKAFYKVADASKSCIRITDKEDGTYKITVCTQCGKCAEVCNTGMITAGPNGVYRLNKKECVGCLMCVGFCPDHGPERRLLRAVQVHGLRALREELSDRRD